jgi:hypothetical protein
MAILVWWMDILRRLNRNASRAGASGVYRSARSCKYVTNSLFTKAHGTNPLLSCAIRIEE